MLQKPARVLLFIVCAIAALEQEAAVVVSTSPAGNEKAASRTANIQATADADIESSTVTQSTFRVHGHLTGSIAGTYGATGATFQLDPTASFRPGELIRATATSDIETTTAVALEKRVWQFTAASGVATGGMTAHATPSFGGGSGYEVALGDLDGDGDLDAVVANQGGADTVWLNDGTGVFTAHPTTPSIGFSNSLGIGLGDIEGDGDLDAVVSKTGGGGELVWVNDGTGGFSAHPTTPAFGTGSGTDVELGDLDGDGDLDAVVSNADAAETVWVNDGAGNFSAHPLQPTFGGTDSTWALALGDVDGDGDLDVVTANGNVSEVEGVWINDGSGQMSLHSTTFQAGGTTGVALGDLDGDGDLDAVFANQSSAAESVWVNDGTGTFTAHPTTPTFGAENSYDVALGDLNGDGDLDAVVANFGSAETVWMNDGAGSFSAHSSVPAFGSGSSTGVTLGDLDGDGDLDVLVSNYFNEAETVWLNAGITVTPTSGLVTTEAGGTATFTVVLDAAPAADVSIQVDTSDATEGRVSTDGVTQQDSVTLTFTTSDWSTPQTVTVHGRNDSVDDGNIVYTLSAGAATSTDPLFSGIDPVDVSASNTDDDTAGITVSPTTLLSTLESNPTFARTFTVVLVSQPTADVSIQIDSDDTTEARVSSDNTTFQSSVTITFTTANWNTARTIWVRGVDDLVDDGNVAFTLTTQPATSTDPLYSGLNPSNVSGTTVDNDTAGLTVVGLMLYVSESGTSDTFTVKLNSEPTAGVVLDVTPSDAGEASVSPSQLTFNDNDWSTPKLVTVTGVDDAADDGNQATTIDVAVNAGLTGDSVYDSVAGASVPVLTIDDEVVLIVATSPASEEASAPLSGNIQATGDETMNAATVTASTFRVHGRFSGRIDGTYGGSGASFHLDPTSNLQPGERIDATVTGGVESGGGSPVTPYVWQFTATAGKSTGGLFPHPAGASFGGGDSEDGALGDIDGDGDLDVVIANFQDSDETVWVNDGSGVFAPHPVTPTFATAGRTSTVVLVDIDGDGDLDALAGDDNPGATAWVNDGAGSFSPHPTTPGFSSNTITKSIGVGDLDGDGDLDAVTANQQSPSEVFLNDGNGSFSLHPYTPGFGTVADFIEDLALSDLDGDGDLDAVTVKQAASPSANVWLNDGFGNFSAHPTAPAFATASGLALRMGDLDGDDDSDAVVIHIDVPPTVWVNDGSGVFSAHPTAPAIGSQSAYSASLADMDGDGDLDALLADGPYPQETLWLNDGSGVFAPSAVTPEFGNDGTSRTLTGDLDGDGDLDVVLVNGYLSLAETVWLNAGVSVGPHKGLVTSEDGLTASFNVTLDAQPSANVTIQLDSSDPSEALLSTDGATQQSSVTLTFTPFDWAEPQTVTVHGQDDALVDGTVPYTITTGATVSGDPAFSGIAVFDVAGVNLDEDSTGVTVSPRSVSVSESGTTSTFDVSLDTLPTGDVVIDVSSLDPGEATVAPSQLTFTPGNFATPQPVTVTGVDDAIDDGSQLTRLSVAVNAALTVDSTYDAIDPPDVMATTTDDDFAIIATNPDANETSAPRAANLTATAEGAINAATVSATTLRVRGSFTATTSGTYAVAGATMQFDPANDLKPGEKITMTATSGIESASSVPLLPHVWQFTAAASIATSAVMPRSAFGSGQIIDVALGDLDADGDLDAVTANYSSEPERVFLNDGSGNFSQHMTFGGASTGGIALGDLDGDGDLDAVAANYDASGSTVWVSDGSGNFTPHATPLLAGTGSSNDAALGDLDADGDLDAVFARYGSDLVWLNGGTGLFSPHPVTPALGGADGSYSVALGDVDRDGDLDAVITSLSVGSTNHEERVWLNDGSGSFSAPSSFPSFDAGNAAGVALGDLDGDGDLDAVVNSFSLSEGTSVWLNAGAGRFFLHPLIPRIATGVFNQDTGLGDLDGDGDLDAVLAARSGDPETIWRNDGTGGFTPHPVTPSVGGGDSSAVAIGDVDGDGDLDAVVGHSFSSSDSVLINRNPAGIIVTPTSGLTTTEGGGTAAFTVVLASEPIANVQIQIDSSDASEGRVSTDAVTQQDSVTLTFTPANWSTPQPVTVHGQNDAVDDGDIGFTLTTSAATSSDPLYSGLAVADVSATNEDDDAPFGPPPAVTAAATSTSNVLVSWGAVAGATSYEVWRTTAVNVAYTLVTTTAALSFNDPGRTVGTTYLYKVRTNGSGGPSSFSAVDAATTVVFTDPVVTTAAKIKVKAVHVTQLRTAVNAMRAAGVLAPATFTDSAPTLIKRLHIVELRTALDQARSAIGLGALTYTDPTITLKVTKVKAVHIAETRAGTQ